MDTAKQRELEENILKSANQQKITCKNAFTIAAEADCALADVGKACDRLKIKITGCQLGCF